MWLLVESRPAAAQRPERVWTATVAGGIALQPDDQADHLTLWGGHVAAGATVRLTAALGLRAEVLQSGFGVSSSHVHGPCLPDPDPEPFACHPPAGPVRLRAFTLGLTGGPTNRAGYVTLGGGAYRLSAHPIGQSDTRVGVYAGVGRLVGKRFPSLALEAQLHWLPGLTFGGEWSVPVRVGLTF